MEPPGNPLFHPEVMAALGTVITTALSYALIRLARYLGKKTQMAWVESLLLRLGDAAVKAVRAVYQEYVEAIKEAREDGKLTHEEKLAALEKAKQKLYSLVSLGELVRLFGSEEQAENAVEDHIEAAVNLVKKSSKTPEINLGPFSPTS